MVRLSPMPARPRMSLDDLHPYFVGSYAENADVLEELVLEFLRDHVYWRRNFHPESRPPIPTSARYRDDFVDVLARTRRELLSLSADLKKSVPWFSPRYIGHMASDLLIPGLVAHLVTTLYNPNNVAEEAAPATLDKEIEVGFQLAEMFGFEVDPEDTQAGWGHLTSGGTVANYEGVRNLFALKFYPLAAAETVEALDVEFGELAALGQPIGEASTWELVNLTVGETVDLRHELLRNAHERGEGFFREFRDELEARRIESRGMVAFFRDRPDLQLPVVLAPQTAHYSWPKAMKVLQLGREQLVEVEVDDNMRMEPGHLRERLAEMHRERRPVLAIVGILGTTEFGTVDPIETIVEARDEWRDEGLEAPIHVDAAWGGYLASMFRRADGGFVGQDRLRANFRYFPGDTVYGAFSALSEVDSITVDPHKLGYVPYPAGAYVAKNAGMIDFVAERAPYAFPEMGEGGGPTLREKLRNLGQYILEGSKPGAAAASVYVSHNVLPLHTEAFGSILKETVRASEYFFDQIDELADRLSSEVLIEIPFEPDCNVVCVAVNPVDNDSAAKMNAFVQGLYDEMRVDASKPVQNRPFFVSSTALGAAEMSDKHIEKLTAELGLDPETLVDAPASERHADHLLLLRNTLMNPWLMFEEEGKNYVDRYLEHLESLIEEHL